jgi:hypothetical protein
MNYPTCYEVYQTKAGWHARLDGLDEPISFITREHAVKIARAAALDLWQLEGQPSRVTVTDQDGRIVQDVNYDADHSGESLDLPEIVDSVAQHFIAGMVAPSSATKPSMQRVG